jgi:hypothetical protein
MTLRPIAAYGAAKHRIGGARAMIVTRDVMTHAIGVVLVSATVCWISGPVGAQQIGNATEARNQVSGKLNARVRPISKGAGVSTNEAVSTGPASAGAFRFVDGSNLNVGEKSTVVLDRFVYDPNGGRNVVLNVSKGAMRFVSGGVGGRATVVTQGAVLGIRN